MARQAEGFSEEPSNAEVLRVLQGNLTDRGLWEMVQSAQIAFPGPNPLHQLEVLGERIATAALNTPSTPSIPATPSTRRTRHFTTDSAPLTFWERFKREFHKFICTNDEKYSEVKKELSQHSHKGQLVVVSSIASAIASVLGVAAGVLVPLVALCLLAVLKIGKEAYCARGSSGSID